MPLRPPELCRRKPCVPGRFNHAGLVCGRGVRQKSTLVLQIRGVGREASFLTPENKVSYRNANERTATREEGSSVRRSMKSSGERLRYLGIWKPQDGIAFLFSETPP